MKYYEILPTHTETPRNTTRKIANLYIEFNYHFLFWHCKKKSHYFWTGVYVIYTIYTSSVWPGLYVCSEITLLKLLPHFPGANGLSGYGNMWESQDFACCQNFYA